MNMGKNFGLQESCKRYYSILIGVIFKMQFLKQWRLVKIAETKFLIILVTSPK